VIIQLTMSQPFGFLVMGVSVEIQPAYKFN
jgi:hypothetical protein